MRKNIPMKKMKAFVRLDAVSQDVKLDEVPIPEIQADEVLINVKAFGVGIHDRYYIPTDISFPYVIGSEGAGVIAEIGKQVNAFKVGDRVIFTTILQPQGGSWAEYAVAKAAILIPLPDNVTFEEGATIPVAVKTGLECMRALNLEKDDTLFIAGASGAIGTIVIQLATNKGIIIAASASEKNHAYMKSLGVEKAVDYKDADWKTKVKEWANGGVTAALAIQPGTGIDSVKVVMNNGKLITVSGDNTSVSPERNILINQMGHHEDTHEKVIDFVEAMSDGEFKTVIEKKYIFEYALDALKKTETRHARGKLVVEGLR